MSLYGVMRTGVSGMGAQASKLATVADNIANAGTNGYKRASTEFSSLILDSSAGSYTSGGITTNVRYAVSQQGALQYTTSTTDLAVSGNGFFVVSDANGTPFLTRAGSFIPDGAGDLVNAGGFKLMGVPVAGGAPGALTANSLGGLEPVNIGQMALEATASTAGAFAANLPANAATGTVVNASLTVYDRLGEAQRLDIAFTNLTVPTLPPAPPALGQWEATITGWAGGPVTVPLGFDADGQLTAPATAAVTTPDGTTIDLDFSDMTQVAADYTPMKAAVDGNAPSAVRDVEIGKDGTLYAIFENGARRATFRVPLADVPSPDNLKPLAGNVYSPSLESGDVQVGFPDSGGLGSVVSGALEQSNVDLAAELTAMIESQRSYTTNSKAFQTGADLLDVLVNLKR